MVALLLILFLGVAFGFQDEIPGAGFKCKQPNMTSVDLPADIALKLNYQVGTSYISV